jgi:hypothetical protein
MFIKMNDLVVNDSSGPGLPGEGPGRGCKRLALFAHLI